MNEPLKHGSLLQAGRYQIESVLGIGGFGITYLAFQPALMRHIAIKEFFLNGYCNRVNNSNAVQLGNGTQESFLFARECLTKFLREAVNLGKLNHPRIVHVMEVFEENGTAYYAMDYITGGSLEDKIKREGRIYEIQAIKYFRQLADAVSYLHSLQMNHLDIKPANILLDSNNNVVLVDFGLSKHFGETSSNLTRTANTASYSEGYSPIEQHLGSITQFSPTADIYSMGATLFRMITGKMPPSAQYMNEHNGVLPDPGVFISSGTLDAITSAMKVQPCQRPACVQDLLEIIEGSKRHTCDKSPSTLNANSESYRPPLPNTGSEKIKRIYEAKKAAEKKIRNKSEIMPRVWTFILHLIEGIFIFIIILLVLSILAYYIFPYLASQNENIEYEVVQKNVVDYVMKLWNVAVGYFR